MTSVWYGFAAVCLAVIAVVTWRALRQGARRCLAIQRLALACGGQAKGDRFEGQFERTAYRGYCEMPLGSEAQALMLHLAVPCAVPGWFAVCRRHRIAVFVSWVFPARCVQVGDPTFDSAFVVTTPSPSLARAFFADAMRREMVRRLFALGHTRLELDRAWLDAQWPARHTHLEDVTAAFIQQTIRCLGAIAEHVPAARRVAR